MTDNFKTIKDNTIGSYAEPLPRAPAHVADPQELQAQEDQESLNIANRLEDQSSPPIFLKRNLKAMRKVRGKDVVKQVQNAMEMHVLPSLNSIVYNQEQEDVYVHPRWERKTKLEVAPTLIKQDLEK